MGLRLDSHCYIGFVGSEESFMRCQHGLDSPLGLGLGNCNWLTGTGLGLGLEAVFVSDSKSENRDSTVEAVES